MKKKIQKQNTKKKNEKPCACVRACFSFFLVFCFCKKKNHKPCACVRAGFLYEIVEYVYEQNNQDFVNGTGGGAYVSTLSEEDYQHWHTYVNRTL